MAFQPQVNPQTFTILPNLSAEALHAPARPSACDYLLSGLHSSIVAGICLTAAWRWLDRPFATCKRSVILGDRLMVGHKILILVI